MREEEATADITSMARLFGNRSVSYTASTFDYPTVVAEPPTQKSVYKLLDMFETDINELGSNGANQAQAISSDRKIWSFVFQ